MGMKNCSREGKEANTISIVNLEAFRNPKHWQMTSGLHHHCLFQRYTRYAPLTLSLVIFSQESLLARCSSLTA